MLLSNLPDIINASTIISGASTIVLLIIAFFLSRFVKQYDNRLEKFAEKLEVLERQQQIKMDVLKEEIRLEILKMNEDKYKYRLEQTRTMANIQTTQNVMVATLKEIREDQKQFYKRNSLP